MFEYPFYDRYVFSSFNELLNTTVHKYGEKIGYQFLEGKTVVSKTYNEFYSDVCAFTGYLKANDLIGKHIGMIGRTSYPWLVAYFAIIISGSVAVPIDKELDVGTMIEQLLFADVSCVLFDETYRNVICGLSEKNKSILTLCFDVEMLENSNSLQNKPDKVVDDVDVLLPAEISFTSGTSGKSKAVLLSHKNIITDACCCAGLLNPTSDSKVLSVLPINHMFEIITSVLCSMYFGLTLCLNDSLRNIKKNLLRFQPAIMVVVPLFVETFYKEITETIRKKRLTIPFAFLRFISFVLKKVGIDVSRRLFKSVHTQFGGNLNLFVCGGAFLDDSKIKFFDSIGITILQGYGITECSPVVSAQTDRYTRMGAVGKVLPCTKVKIVDGEIAVQGDNVMIGYYKNQPLTDEAIVDGWFYTGDLGHLDEDNFLYLTGRKKNLIILSNGQNVSPEELELKLQNISEIKEALVYGENGQVCAEIFYGEYSADIEETIRVHIGQLMKGWPIYKQIQIIKFRYEEFEKTTTRKIKR